MAGLRLPRLHAPFTALSGDRAGRARSLFQRGENDFVGVSEAGLLASERTHANALLDAGAAVLHDAVFQRPRLFARQLEIHISEID